MRALDSSMRSELIESTTVEALLFELSARFINLRSEQVDQEIEDALRRICECLGIDRSTVWEQPLDEPDSIILTHTYQYPGGPDLPSRIPGQPLFPWTIQQLKRGETIAVSKMEDLPREASRDKESWCKYQTRSSLIMPLAIGGEGFGALAFASVRAEHEWPDILVKRLQVFGGVLANAIARARNDRALRQTRERYALAVDGANDGLWDWDILTDEIYLSPRWKAMLGYEDHELAQRFSVWEDLLHPDDRERAMATLQAHLSGREPVYELEHRLRHKDGTYRWILARGKALRDSDGRPYRMAGSHSDITDRKRAEAALAESQAQIVAVVESTNDLIWSVDPEKFGILTFNTGLATYFLRNRGITMRNGLTPDDLLPPDYALRWREFYKRALKQGSFVTEYATVSGTNVLLLSMNPLKRNGEVFGISVFGKDITDRKRVEEELRRSEERFRHVAENVGDFIWEADANGLYTYTSPSVKRILGYSPDELVGKLHFYDLFAPEVRDELKAAALEVFAARRPFRTFPNANVSKAGKIVHLETSGTPVLDEFGNLAGYRGSDTDVTERKQAEEQLRRTLDEVQGLREQLQQQNVYLRQEVQLLHGHTRLVGRSRPLKQVLAQVEQVAPTGSTVLLLGETGTGKELIASAIHDLSPRRGHPMVRVNCSAIPGSLIESELFGREKGAYTGALSKQIGRFELANGSTLFLDEVGDLPPEIQIKLLRVLQERQIERLGSPRPIPVDVRIIAATNQDLEPAIREGRFRQDLYYRLNVFPIQVPPLRERREDIPLLVSAFVEEFGTAMGKNIQSVSRQSMDALDGYHWPGNVRELRNVIERAMIVASGSRLWIEPPGRAGAASTLRLAMKDVDREHIQRVLEMTGWRIRGANGAAEVLGVKPTTLESRMAKLGIRRADRNGKK